MNRTQQFGLILLAFHIAMHISGGYNWLNRTTYDVVVIKPGTAVMYQGVDISPEQVAVVPDSGRVVLYQGLLGDRMEVAGVSRVDIVAVRYPVFGFFHSK